MDSIVSEFDQYKRQQAAVATGVTDGTQESAVTWRNAAIRVGEDLCSVGPIGYYDMTADQWLDWALSVVTVHAPPPQLNDKLEAMAIECERMPFGDTAGSFAAWIRGHKV